MIDTIFYSLELALILHLAIGFVAKYPAWVRNGRSFHPSTPQPTEAPAEVEQQPEPVPAMAATMAGPVAVAVVEVEPVAGDDLAELTTVELRKRCIEHNQGLPKGHPDRIKGAARLRKSEALKALGA